MVKNYTGYEYDAVLDLYYAKNRMYDATNHRFTQLDPIRDGDNWYAYVGNNPVNYTDPLGLLAYPGEIHQAVVTYIRETYGYETEQLINYNNGKPQRSSGSYGRADVITPTGGIYEVKPISIEGSFSKLKCASAQLDRYLNGTWVRRASDEGWNEKYSLHRATQKIGGTFGYTSFDGDHYEVSFSSKSASEIIKATKVTKTGIETLNLTGLITYEYKKVSDAEWKVKVKENAWVVIYVVVVGAALYFGGPVAGGAAAGAGAI